MLVCLPGGIRFSAGPTSTAGYPIGVIRLRRLTRRGSKAYERLATEVCRLLSREREFPNALLSGYASLDFRLTGSRFIRSVPRNAARTVSRHLHTITGLFIGLGRLGRR